MADYSAFLFNAFAGPGQAVSERRQEDRANMESDRNYARALGLDDWRKQVDERDFNRLTERDRIGDSQWERGFSADQSYRGQSLALQRQKMQQDLAGGTEYGLAPVYLKDQQGNLIFGQMAKDGTFKRTEIPEGFVPAPGVDRADLGTSWGYTDKRTGLPVNNIAKDVAGEYQQKEIGSAEGKTIGDARSRLLGAQQSLASVKEKIESLRNDQYLPNMLGAWDSRTPDITVDAARVRGKMDQLQGESFMQARELLKGAGPITDFEGQKADQAMARLNRAQSPEDYKQALDDFQMHIENGFRILEQQAAAAGGQQGGGDPLSRARAAIQAGADPRAVAERLRNAGIDPSGL